MPKPINREDPETWRFVQRSDGWWVVGVPLDCYEDGECGPAKTFEEAQDNKRGLVAFIQLYNETCK